MKMNAKSVPQIHHPTLFIVNPQGVFLVIGDRQQQLDLKPKQMRNKAMEFIKYAEEQENSKTTTHRNL